MKNENFGFLYFFYAFLASVFSHLLAFFDMIKINIILKRVEKYPHYLKFVDKSHYTPKAANHIANEIFNKINFD